MRYFLDTEFVEDGSTIVPLSLGINTESGAALYIVFEDADRSLANTFVQVAVIPHLDDEPPPGVRYVRCGREEAAHVLLQWVNEHLEEGVWSPEFWAECGAYDWVLVCQLFGTMDDLPEGWPYFIRDVEHLRADVGWDGPYPYEEGRNDALHNAINDSFGTRENWRFLTALRDTELTPEVFLKADLDASRGKHPSNGTPDPTN